MLRGEPVVPCAVHLGLSGDIGHPDVGGKDTGLIGASLFQTGVDVAQNAGSLREWRAVGRLVDLAGEVDEPVMDDDLVDGLAGDGRHALDVGILLHCGDAGLAIGCGGFGGGGVD